MATNTPLALAAPTVEVDALPYIDSQYNDPALKAQVDALVKAEMASFRPERDYLEPWPMHEPNFESSQLLQAEWMRVCDKQPMPKMDVSRYQLDPPPPAQQNDLAAWERAVNNAQAQLEHQGTRLGNLELLAAHGAPLWKAHLSTLDAAAASFSRAQEEVDAQIEAVNRKRKSDQLAAGPRLVHLESQWVAAVKKNLEIEAQCLRLEATCAQLKEAVEAKRQAR